MEYRIEPRGNHFTIQKKFGSSWKTLQKNKQNRTFDTREEGQKYLDNRVTAKKQQDGR